MKIFVLTFLIGYALAGGHGDHEVGDVSPEMHECMDIAHANTKQERIDAWLCEHTRYIRETVEWIEDFESWWSGCNAYVQGQSVWDDPSYSCPNTSMVKCMDHEKRKCVDDRMGCQRCTCTDAKYKDSAALFALWKFDMKLFKKRFNTYKMRVQTCDDEVDMSGSGSGDMMDGDEDSESQDSSPGDDDIKVHV